MVPCSSSASSSSVQVSISFGFGINLSRGSLSAHSVGVGESWFGVGSLSVRFSEPVEGEMVWLRCDGPGRFSTSSTRSARDATLLVMVVRCAVNVSDIRRSSSAIPMGSLELARLAVGGASWG